MNLIISVCKSEEKKIQLNWKVFFLIIPDKFNSSWIRQMMNSKLILHQTFDDVFRYNKNLIKHIRRINLQNFDWHGGKLNVCKFKNKSDVSVTFKTIFVTYQTTYLDILGHCNYKNSKYASYLLHLMHFKHLSHEIQ